MTARVKALSAWVDAVIHDITDLPKIRAARAEFEKINGPQSITDLCGDYVPLTESKPERPVPVEEAPVEPQGMRYEKKKERKVYPCELKTPEKTAIGGRLQMARIAAGFARARDFAEAVGVPTSSVQTVESGFSPLSEDRSKLFAQKLNVTAGWLRFGQ